MPDVHSPAQRSRNMAAIHGIDTAPELALRRRLHAAGFRFRLHQRSLPGHPDLVLAKFNAVIFVNGCFWHTHDCKYGGVVPATRPEFWARKRAATVERDARNNSTLRSQGWRVHTVWECELKHPDEAVARAVKFLEAGGRRSAGSDARSAPLNP